MTTLHFTLESRDGRTPVAFDVSNFVIAGWAGRNREAMEHHIRELEALGVARPAATPTYYRVAAARLTTAAEIEDAGTAGSGEVEVRARSRLKIEIAGAGAVNYWGSPALTSEIAGSGQVSRLGS